MSGNSVRSDPWSWRRHHHVQPQRCVPIVHHVVVFGTGSGERIYQKVWNARAKSA